MFEGTSNPDDLVRSFVENIGDLDGRPYRSRPPGRALAQLDRGRLKHSNQLLVQAVGAFEVKLSCCLLVLVDESPVCRGQLCGPSGNGVEHGRQIQSRTDGLADLTERAQF